MKYLEPYDHTVILEDHVTLDLSVKAVLQLKKAFNLYDKNIATFSDNIKELKNGMEFSFCRGSLSLTPATKNKANIEWDMTLTTKADSIPAVMSSILNILKRSFNCEVINLSADYKERNKTFKAVMMPGERNSWR